MNTVIGTARSSRTHASSFTPAERLRPHTGGARIEYGPNGAHIVRSGAVRMDPAVTPGERAFDRVMEQIAVAMVWIGGIGLGCYSFYWALTEATKFVYTFAFNHPIGR